MHRILFGSAAVMLCSAVLTAETVQITATGVVEYNQIGAAPLGDVGPGDDVVLTFEVDSEVFSDSLSFPTRGYRINAATYSFSLGAVTLPLQSPFPAGQTPFFVIRNDDPGVDGFWVSTSIDFPLGVPINQTGVFGQFINNYSVTYAMTTLSSLNILDAQGSYDFSGLQVFNWTVDDGPFNPLGIVIEELVIAAMSCTADLNADGAVDAADLALLLGAWGPNPGNPADFNTDGIVDAADLALLLGAWGPC